MDFTKLSLEIQVSKLLGESIEFEQLNSGEGYDGAEGDETGEPQIGYVEFETDRGFPVESEVIVDRTGITIVSYDGDPMSGDGGSSIWFKQGSSVEETTEYARNNIHDGVTVEDLKRLGFEKQNY